MKTIASLLLIALLSSYTYKITCDTNLLYGKWLLVDSYDEDDVNIDTLLNMKIVDHQKASLKFLRGGYVNYDDGEHTTREYYTVDRGRCRVETMGLTSMTQRMFYIQYLDEKYLIGLERGKIYFYEKEEE